MAVEEQAAGGEREVWSNDFDDEDDGIRVVTGGEGCGCWSGCYGGDGDDKRDTCKEEHEERELVWEK